MKYIAPFVALLLSSAPLSYGVSLTSFGNVAAPTMTVNGLTSFTTNQFASSLDISGTDFGDTLVGEFASVNIGADETALTLYLAGTHTGTATSTFTIDIFDSGFAAATFSGGSWVDLNSQGFTALTYLSGAMDSTDVVAMQINTGGAGDTVISTLTALQTTPVPEPSTYTLMAGMLGLAYVLVRRRK